MLKEHPHVVTTSLRHDNSTIKYDITKKNRSDAVGKVYKINADGRAELPADGEAFDGVIIAVDDKQITGAYICGGLRVPLAKAADGTVTTVARGNMLVAGVDASNSDAKGYVKAVAFPSDLTELAEADVDTDAERVTAHNAVRTQINAVVAALKGKGYVLEFDTAHALLTL